MQRNLFQASTAVVLLLLFGCCHCCLLDFEAENGKTSRGVTYQSRSGASGGRSVYLTENGQHVIHTLSTDAVCIAQVCRVLYSNDGPSDVIEVSLDGTTLGNFTTREKSNNGYAWNEFQDMNTDSVRGTIEIRPGSHELTLTVVSTDRYGVELDKTSLQLTCEGSRTCGEQTCPWSTSEDTATADQDSPTTDGGTTNEDTATATQDSPTTDGGTTNEDTATATQDSPTTDGGTTNEDTATAAQDLTTTDGGTTATSAGSDSSSLNTADIIGIVLGAVALVTTLVTVTIVALKCAYPRKGAYGKL